MPVFETYEQAIGYMASRVEQGYQCQMKFEMEGVRVECVYRIGTHTEPAKPNLPPQEQPALARYASAPPPTIKASIRQETIPDNLKQIDLPHELRDYQQQAVQFALGHPHSIIELPTGRGKSLVALSIVDEYVKDMANLSTLVIVPTALLLTQWVEDGFKSAGVGATSVSGEGKLWSKFTVITYQSAIRNLELVSGFDIVVFDEVHHLFSPEYSSILKVLLVQPKQKYLIGLTATVRTIGEGLAMQRRYFPDIFTMRISEFQERSETKIPVHIHAVPVTFTESEMRIYENLQSTISAANRQIGPMPAWIKAMKEPGTSGRLAGAAMSAYAEQNSLLANLPAKTAMVVQIINGNSGQFIVFSDRVAQIQRYEEALQGIGVTEGSIYGGVSATRRSAIMSGLRDGSIRVLVGGNAITEGVDLPNMANGILTTFLVREQRTLTQRIGRLLRPAADKIVNIWLVYVTGTKEEANAMAIEKILGESVINTGGL